jgi:uncharacterized membrane protein (DUF373 family)
VNAPDRARVPSYTSIRRLEGREHHPDEGVLLIALLALAREFIVLEMHEYTALAPFALAATTLALGVTYWLLRDREERQGAPSR